MARGHDFFTVELQTPTGQQLPSIEYDGQRYFVGEPGQEFVVAVTRSVRYPTKLYQVSLGFMYTFRAPSQQQSHQAADSIRCLCLCYLALMPWAQARLLVDGKTSRVLAYMSGDGVPYKFEGWCTSCKWP